MDETELIRRVLGGDHDAFADLVKTAPGTRAGVSRIVTFGTGVAVDDLAQEVFITMYRSLATYDGRVPLIAWLIGIARHRKLAYLRDEARRVNREGGDLEIGTGRLAAGHGLGVRELRADSLPTGNAGAVHEEAFRPSLPVDPGALL